MRTFPAQPSSFVRCLPRFFVETSRIIRHYKRRIGIAGVLAASLLMVITAIGRQRIPSIASILNGVLFSNPNGASQTYAATGSVIALPGSRTEGVSNNRKNQKQAAHQGLSKKGGIF